MSFEYVKRGTFYPVEIEGRGFTAVAESAASNVGSCDGRIHWHKWLMFGECFKTLAELKAKIEDCADREYFRMVNRKPANKISRVQFFVEEEYADEFLSDGEFGGTFAGKGKSTLISARRVYYA